jgi:hypothetical protein
VQASSDVVIVRMMTGTHFDRLLSRYCLSFRMCQALIGVVVTNVTNADAEIGCARRGTANSAAAGVALTWTGREDSVGQGIREWFGMTRSPRANPEEP